MFELDLSRVYVGLLAPEHAGVDPNIGLFGFVEDVRAEPGDPDARAAQLGLRRAEPREWRALMAELSREAFRRAGLTCVLEPLKVEDADFSGLPAWRMATLTRPRTRLRPVRLHWLQTVGYPKDTGSDEMQRFARSLIHDQPTDAGQMCLYKVRLVDLAVEDGPVTEPQEAW